MFDFLWHWPLFKSKINSSTDKLKQSFISLTFKSKISIYLLFADDFKLYMQINSTDDFSDFQADSDGFYGWCVVNGSGINIIKCIQNAWKRVFCDEILS